MKPHENHDGRFKLSSYEARSEVPNFEDSLVPVGQRIRTPLIKNIWV